MRTSDIFPEAVRDWERSAEQVITIAVESIPLDSTAFTERFGAQDVTVVDEETEKLLERSDVVFEELRPHLDDDPDARARFSALLAGNLQVVDALVSAADEPSTVSDELGIDPASVELATWIRPLAEYRTALLLGVPRIQGGTPEAPAPIESEIDELGTAAGTEVVALATDAVLAYSSQMFLDGLVRVASGTAASVLDGARDAITGAFTRLKRAAHRVITWLVDRITRLLPSSLRPRIVDAANALAGGVGQLVGAALTRVLGSTDTIRKWAEADSGDALDAALETAKTATDPHLARIGWMTQGRETVNRWGARVIVPLVTDGNPVGQIAFVVVVAAVFVFVCVQVWDGLRDLEALAPS
jgi:hypothetical protein